MALTPRTQRGPFGRAWHCAILSHPCREATLRWRVSRVALLLFCSGTCALIYQTAWFREMRLVFGMSTAASAAVLAIFMGGLGIGGLKLGPIADRHERPLRLYGMLELGVSLATAATPFLIWVARTVYTAAGGTPSLGMFFGTVLRLILAALVLAVPTVLMGGTLPAAARAVESDDDTGRRDLALLYGANTFGAVTGTALASFVLLEALGCHAMLYLATGLNALVGLTAIAISGNEKGTQALAPAGEVQEALAPRGFVLVAAFAVGFAFFLMELVWYRMLAPLLGGSSYTFGLILVVALAGIGLGGAAASLGSRARPSSASAFALTCSLEAFFLALPLLAGDRIAVAALLIRPLGDLGFGSQLLAWGLVAGVVVFPAAFVSGVQFPLLIALLGRGREGVGSDTGAAYAANTAGAIVGSLAGGFGLLPLLTAPGAWRLSVAVLAVLGVVAAAFGFWRNRATRKVSLGIGAMAAACVAGLLAPGPTAAWRHSAIGAGRSRITDTTLNGVREWLNNRRRDIRWEADGVESAIGLSGGDGWSFLVAGKSDGNARGDAPTQVMSGLLGALFHPAPRSAFVVGLGTGSTAGWLAAVPGIEQVDVAELEPAVLEVARRCAAVNHDALSNPKVNVIIGDAREILLASSRTYDVIFSEPSNPYRAGISSLFTVEFYEAVRRRLAEGGLFLQWLQAYEVDANTIRTVYATLSSVFEAVETWRTKGGDLILVASSAPLVHDVARLRERFASEPFRSAALAVWRATEVEDLLAHFVASSSLARAVATLEGDRLNSDDRNRVEFAFARTVGRKLFRVDELVEIAHERGEDRPALTGGEVDFDRVSDAMATAAVADDTSPDILDRMTPSQRARAQALEAFGDDRLLEAISHWKKQEQAPRTPVEVAMMAEGLAEAGDQAAVEYAQRLGAWEPGEADLVMGRLLARSGKEGEAVDYLVKAFKRFRDDPWALPCMMRRGLTLVYELSLRDSKLAARLYEAVAAPYAVNVLDNYRQEVAAAVATASKGAIPCAEAYGAMEPNPPWRMDFLKARADCYAQTEDLRVVAAVDDLLTYLAAEPTKFAAGL